MIDIPRLRKVAADTDAYTQCQAIPTQDMDAQQLQLTAGYWKRQLETRNALPELLDEIEALRKRHILWPDGMELTQDDFDTLLHRGATEETDLQKCLKNCHTENETLRKQCEKFRVLHSESVRDHAAVVWENDVPYSEIVALRKEVALEKTNHAHTSTQLSNTISILMTQRNQIADDLKKEINK